MMRSGNPTLNDRVFRQSVSGTSHGVAQDGVMTIDGTVNKAGLSILFTVAAAYYSFTNPGMAKFYIPLIIGTLILGLIISFKPKAAPMLTPVFALAEGLMLGSISLMFEIMYPGIVFQAVGLTIGTFIALLFVYKSGWIKVTANFKLGVAAATGGIMIVYLLSFALSFFGISMSFLHDSSPLSIGISAVVIVVASLNLVMDFDFIENAAATGRTPKYMEWYAAFGLLVTLVWLYLEILRLLAKLNDRR